MLKILNEEWKTITDFQDYEVSNLGQVRRRVYRNYRPAGKLLSQTPNQDGYNTVSLCNGPLIRKRIQTHSLVMREFVGPCPTGYEINHIDLDKRNNRLDNLEYLTHSENVLHANNNGSGTRGEKHGNVKLTKDKVIEIRILYESKEFTENELAKKYRVTRSAINHILRRTRWSWL